MSQQPENQTVIDIPENITDVMNNSHTGEFDNAVNESTQQNSIQSPSTSSQDIPENTTDVMNNSHTGEFDNANNESTQHNPIQLPSQYYGEQRPGLDRSAPPSYEDCTDLSKLPSYEEVYMETLLGGETSTRMPGRIDGGQPNVEIPGLFAQAYSVLNDAARTQRESDLLGTNLAFVVAFAVALIFNWFGFLAIVLTCNTVAARYGALAGFGFSLTQWTMKVKNGIESYLLLPENRELTFIWWIVFAFGCLICVSTTVKYINVKRGWRRQSDDERARVLYFY